MFNPTIWLYILGVAFGFWALGAIALQRHWELGRLLRAFVDDQKARARVIAKARAIRKQQDEEDALNSKNELES
ncbi:MAG: hypothetical protein RLY14_836 [Planctomycetota bacterium]|jgi:hypothetical protein